MTTFTAPAPPLQGDPRFNQYRLWTVRELPWGSLPTYREGGPSTVTCTEWGTSTSETSFAMSTEPEGGWTAEDRMVTLDAIRYRGARASDGFDHHPLHGTKYPTREDANRAGTEAHPVLGDVPICDRCRARNEALR